MEVAITNIYNNKSTPGTDLIGSHGQAFHINIDGEQVLFDIGYKGDILIHNMKKLGIEPNRISKIILSHGHIDHTGGLPYFLDKRTNSEPVTIYGHPNIRETKILKIFFFKKLLSFPSLSNEQLKKVDFVFNNNSIQILPNLWTTGEIKERNEYIGREPNAFHKIDSNYHFDPVLDDQSVILDTKEGIVLLTGCCHAGLINTCKAAQQQFNKPIEAIIGGVHLVRFSKVEVMHVADTLEKEYNTPLLYLNHCTDQIPIPFVKKTKVTELLRQRFGPEIVKECTVGTKVTFKC